MNTQTAMPPATSVASTPDFWDRLWRSAGIQSIGLFLIAFLLYGNPPGLAAPDQALTAFYEGARFRILLASILGGLAVLNLMWFAAALRSVLADSGQGGWGAAASAASAAVGALLLLLLTIFAALTYLAAQAQSPAVLRALNDFAWTTLVLSSFPRAMLAMAAAFGLWRAKRISNGLFSVGVLVVVLVLLGGTTWAQAGLWAPDGVYSRFVTPAVGALWLLVVCGVLLNRSVTLRSAW
jgi:hypothetical protein